ncbi:neurogenic locus notch homolog protein 1-like [Ruditapes philippinarum]|uniref:neurogenic locus notch homolog protein 1-like n=1 Tax=Ruditapes philippinarum TaxID=129788 RepID=UPI00295AA41B|nr:neurogenic locus notch homolog protein 1-like [Ruditapes philippinarum]
MAKQNLNLCSEPVLSQSACPKFCGKCPTTCYNCNITSPDVSSCNTVTCDKNTMCLVEMRKITKTGQVKYSLGCATKHFCDNGVKRELDSRSLTIDCCDKDLCNVPLATTLASTKQTTTATPTPASTATTTITQTTTETTVVTKALNVCHNISCVHGTCKQFGTVFYCVCQQEWTGRTCNSPNYCVSRPCQHGYCTNNLLSYKCICSTGYMGNHCDKVIDYCASNPCVHGHCTNNLTTFKCSCSYGYEGTRCEKICSRDLLVMIDLSLLNYLSTVHFLQNLVNKMQIGSNGVLMEVASFADSSVHNRWRLISYTSKSRLISEIRNQLYHSVKLPPPDIYAPVHSLNMQGTSRIGDRANVPDVALIITGPFRHTYYNVKYEAEKTNINIPITTIGVGNVNTQMLGSIAKNSAHALTVGRVDDLVDNAFVDKVLNLLCS